MLYRMGQGEWITMLEFNPDNTVVLRGRVAQDDFSKTYRILKDGKTTAQIMFAVHNPKKHVSDVVPIRLYGHVVDDDHKRGGMLEMFLSVASPKNIICIYGHISPFDYEYNLKGRGKRKMIVCSIVVDTFRSEGNVKDTSKFIEPVTNKNGLASLSTKYHANENIDLRQNKPDFKMNDEISKTVEKARQNENKPQIRTNCESNSENVEQRLENEFQKYINGGSKK